MFDVLVTGAESRQGIIVIRSLAKRGVKMLVTGDRPHSVGFYSRYISGHALLPSPLNEKTAFVDGVMDLVTKNNIPYIYPVIEASLIALDERRSEVEAGAKLIASSSHTIRCGVDKKITLAMAEQLGLLTTKTCYPQSPEEAEDFAGRCGYPVILKPRGRSNDGRVGGAFDFKVLYAHNRTQLRSALAACRGGVYPMVQEYAYGPHTQFDCFMEKGQAHSCFQDDAIRMLPLTGGVGTRMRSREVDPELAEQSIRLFTVMDWEGCAQAQFKGPGRDGKYRFIEVSVRLPASVGSSVFSGIDFPWMQYQYFTGQQVDRTDRYSVGRSSRWLYGDTITVMRYMMNDMEKSADRLPSKVRVALGWLSDFMRPGLRHYVESFTDPLPGFVDFMQLIKDLAKLLKKNIVSRLQRFVGR